MSLIDQHRSVLCARDLAAIYGASNGFLELPRFRGQVSVLVL